MGYVQWVTGPVVFVHHRAQAARAASSEDVVCAAAVCSL
jgi:hypothetical protein